MFSERGGHHALFGGLRTEFSELVAELLHEYCVAIFYKMDLGIQFSHLK